MIVRLWQGWVPAARAREYEAYQREVGPPGYRVVPGNQGIFMLGQDHGDQYEIAMLTFWHSFDAIRAFAGDPVDKARYYDRDLDFLIDPTETVDHYAIAAAEPLCGEASVIRFWKGRVDSGGVESALELEAKTGIPGYRKIHGNRGVYLLARELGDRHEIAMLSFWDSLDSVREFAGASYRQANYDEYLRKGYDYLIDLPEQVDHFQILEAENLERLHQQSVCR